MKKIAACFALFFAAICVLAAKSPVQKSDDKVEIITDVVGIPDDEQNWLGIFVADRLEANLLSYADFSFINSTNIKEIIKIQSESEGAAYNEAATIEAGKLSAADYGLFVTIKKGGTKYTVTIRYTDLTTGETKATVNGTGDSAESLYADNGCTVDILTIELCDDLGIPLTNAEKLFIMHGEQELSSDEKVKVYDEKIALFEARIADLNKQIDSISLSGEIDADTLKKQLEIEKKLADEKLKVARENQRRAEKEAKKQRDDELLDAKRSAEQKEKINNMSKELQEKYESLRNKKLANEPILGRIKLIELKKKALLEIQDNIDREIKELNTQANDKINKELESITNRPISVVEQGASVDVLSEVAKENRSREFESKKSEIIKDLKDDAKQINDELIKQNKKLLNDIHKDYNNLKNIRVSSLSDDLVVEYGNYDGNKGGWPLFITIKSDDINLFNTTSFLSYKEISGKEPIKDNRDPNFNDFAIDVDTYESLFLRGEPIFTYEVEYSVSPYAPEHPSKYKFKFNYLKYYDTRTMSIWGNKYRASKTGFLYLDSDSVTRQMEPIYDIRAIEANQTATIKIDNVAFDVEEKVASDKSSNNAYDFSGFTEEDYFNYDYDVEKYEEIRREEEIKRGEEEIEAKKREEKEEKNQNNSSGHPYNHSLFGINAGFGLTGIEGPSVELELDFAIFDFLYWGLSSTSFFPKKAEGYNVIPDVTYLMTNQAKLGINLDLFFFNVYGSLGLGANYFTYIESWAKDRSVLPATIPNDFKFIYSFEVGGSIQFSKHFAITCGYMMVFSDSGKNRFGNLDFGMAFAF